MDCLEMTYATVRSSHVRPSAPDIVDLKKFVTRIADNAVSEISVFKPVVHHGGCHAHVQSLGKVQSRRVPTAAPWSTMLNGQDACTSSLLFVQHAIPGRMALYVPVSYDTLYITL